MFLKPGVESNDEPADGGWYAARKAMVGCQDQPRMILTLRTVLPLNPQEVMDILCDDDSAFSLRNGEDDGIRTMLTLRIRACRGDIMPPQPQLLSDGRCVHRVEEKPHRQTEARLCCQLALASSARRSFLSIHASISSVYSA